MKKMSSAQDGMKTLRLFRGVNTFGVRAVLFCCTIWVGALKANWVWLRRECYGAKLIFSSTRRTRAGANQEDHVLTLFFNFESTKQTISRAVPY